jgi:hypothetical protein
MGYPEAQIDFHYDTVVNARFYYRFLTKCGRKAKQIKKDNNIELGAQIVGATAGGSRSRSLLLLSTVFSGVTMLS